MTEYTEYLIVNTSLAAFVGIENVFASSPIPYRIDNRGWVLVNEKYRQAAYDIIDQWLDSQSWSENTLLGEGE